MEKILSIPARLMAGARWKFEGVLPAEYDAASGWSMRVYLTNASASHEILPASSEGQAFYFDVAPATTSAIAVGAWKAISFAVSADEEFVELERSDVEVVPDVRAGAYDALSYVERALAAIDARLAGKATLDDEMVMVNGRQIRHYTFADLLKARDYLLAEKERLARAEKIRNGRSPGLVRVRF